jgi:hypothetical protein
VFVDVVEDVRENEGDLEPVAVEFEAEMRQVKSMADGTYNIVLNVPEYCLPQVQTMMGWLKALIRVIMAESDKSG